MMSTYTYAGRAGLELTRRLQSVWKILCSIAQKCVLFHLTILLCLLATSFNGQNIYSTTLFDQVEDDTTFHRLKIKESELVLQSNLIHDNLLECSETVEKESWSRLLMISLKKGATEEVRDFITKPVARNVMSCAHVSDSALMTLTSKMKHVKRETTDVLGIYTKIKKQKYYSKRYSRYKIAKNYNLKNGQSILEIGTGDLVFAEVATRKLRDLTYYVNDLNEIALKRLYFGIHKLCPFQGDRNEFFVVKGSATNTGAEGITFDKIIIRNVVHHFADAGSMFDSIKKSMQSDSELIIEESFNDDILKFKRCPQLMNQNEIRTLLKKHGFTMKSKKKMEYGSRRAWVMVYRLDEV